MAIVGESVDDDDDDDDDDEPPLRIYVLLAVFAATDFSKDFSAASAGE